MNLSAEHEPGALLVVRIGAHRTKLAIVRVSDPLHVAVWQPRTRAWGPDRDLPLHAEVRAVEPSVHAAVRDAGRATTRRGRRRQAFVQMPAWAADACDMLKTRERMQAMFYDAPTVAPLLAEYARLFDAGVATSDPDKAKRLLATARAADNAAWAEMDRLDAERCAAIREGQK